MAYFNARTNRDERRGDTAIRGSSCRLGLRCDSLARLIFFYFVCRTPKVSRVGVVLRAESLFSRTSAGKF